MESRFSFCHQGLSELLNAILSRRHINPQCCSVDLQAKGHLWLTGEQGLVVGCPALEPG